MKKTMLEVWPKLIRKLFILVMLLSATTAFPLGFDAGGTNGIQSVIEMFEKNNMFLNQRIHGADHAYDCNNLTSIRGGLSSRSGNKMMLRVDLANKTKSHSAFLYKINKEKVRFLVGLLKSGNGPKVILMNYGEYTVIDNQLIFNAREMKAVFLNLTTGKTTPVEMSKLVPSVENEELDIDFVLEVE